MDRSIENPGIFLETNILGTIVKIIWKELGKSEDLIAYVADRKGYDQRYTIDPIKASEKFDRGPTMMFINGIKLMIQWYKNHMN